jgi:plastocyanin
VDLASGAVTQVRVGNAPRKIAVQSGSQKRASAGPGITIAGFAFSPETLEVRAGETVTWSNQDGAPHVIALKDGRASDTLMPGQSYSINFERTGTFDYTCSLHPYMAGRVVVATR